VIDKYDHSPGLRQQKLVQRDVFLALRTLRFISADGVR
jgi:hypothetical protein